MYRCGKCGKVSEAREPRKLVTEYRFRPKYEGSEQMRKEIEKETPVCTGCLEKHEAVKQAAS